VSDRYTGSQAAISNTHGIPVMKKSFNAILKLSFKKGKKKYRLIYSIKRDDMLGLCVSYSCCSFETFRLLRIVNPFFLFQHCIRLGLKIKERKHITSTSSKVPTGA
jgi:hypothetical protein